MLSREFSGLYIILMHNTLFRLVKTINNALICCLALIKEFLKKQILNQTVFYDIRVKFFFASNFLIFSWISINIATNSQHKMF